MLNKEQAVTFFTVPKAFTGHSGVIQRNAIKSWTLLRPKPEILLFADDFGTAEIAIELGALHVPEIQRNEFGTPLVHDVFRQAHELATNEILVYVNADVILLNDFLVAIGQIQSASFESFLMIGQRIDVQISEPLDYHSPNWEGKLRGHVLAKGSLASVLCKDFFAFPKTDFTELPAFAIGRGNWDNWVVYHAHCLGIPVIDATRVTTVIHQNHHYENLDGGRKEAYVNGKEARRNAELAGGTHLFKGSRANWTLARSGLKRRRPAFHLVPFLTDFHRFMMILLEFVGLAKKN